MVALLLLLALSREGGPHRLSASLSAVREISALPPPAVAAFLDSFELFGETAASYSGSPADVARLLGYYGVLNHLCAVGDFEKMYLPPRLDPGKGVYGNQLLYEKRMASSLGVGPGDRVLDVGCGRGLVARGVSDGTGAEVTGLNIDPVQLARAESYAAGALSPSSLSFVLGDYNDPLPFPDAHFDAAYYVQVLSYFTDLDAFYAEVFRVVKPGARVVFEDYVQGPNYDASDPHQRELMRLSKPVLGGVCEVKPSVLQAAIEKAGFVVERSEDWSFEGEQYQLMQQSIDFFIPLQKLMSFLATVGLVPDHFAAMLGRMNDGAEAATEAVRDGVTNLGWVTEAVKPLE
ncbi:hypothetical protein TeGR_g2754 [Tetraparma gracilis]|nr:hypothetical protein TeGR_g2754 [Tetraparma gracilis]